MTKNNFLYILEEKLSGLPEAERKKSIEYYAEIIADRVEDGTPEAVVIAELGSIDAIVNDIISEVPLSRLIKAKMKIKKSFEAWEILLIVLGALIVVPIAISLVAAALSLYASLWAVVVSFFAADLSLLVGGVGGVVSFFPLLFMGETATAFILLGCALVALGLTLPFFYISKGLVKLGVLSTKALIFLIKKSIVKKETKK